MHSITSSGQVIYQLEHGGPTWTAPDLMASEEEVSEFLGALVRLLKPKVIVETGTYRGDATFAMAKACGENKHGWVYTCDTDPQYINPLNMYDRISARCTEGASMCAGIPDVDLAFIDSSGDRVAEVQALQLSPGAVVVLHDSKRPQYKPIWTAHPWRVIWEIPTEQGLTLFIL